MTKKHFNAIADAMRYMRKIEIDDIEGSATGVRVVKFSSVVDALAGIMADSNPKFDRNRFLAACGIGTPASDGGLKRDVKAKRQTKANRNPIAEALAAIERQDTVCFDVAAENGQIFLNVKHMKWFVDAVAEAL
jgi:hypothetical protein